jgi:phosphatidyl-myo-inositol dimannoside synthase
MSVFIDLLQPEGRVLVVTNDFPPRYGGIQTFVRQLCDELPPDQVVVYAPTQPGASDYDAHLPFLIVRDPASLLLPAPGLMRRLGCIVRTYDIRQVVFGASVPLGLLAPQFRAVGVTWQVALTHGHEVWWAALPGTRRLLRKVADEVDVVTHVSDYTGRRIRPALSAHGRAKLRKLRPVVGPEFHPGVDGGPVRRELGIAADAPVVVCVARLVRRKGQDRLIRIWPEVLRQFPTAVLLIVGDGSDARRLRRMAARRRLGQHVVFTGEVVETPPYYAAGDVFAMPVRNRLLGLEVEGLGINYLEAAACGLRVIPGRRGGASEAVL